MRGVDEAYWFPQVLLLFHLNVAGVLTEVRDYAFVQCIDTTISIDEIDNILNCLCLQWGTENEIDHSLIFDASQSDIIESGE